MAYTIESLPPEFQPGTNEYIEVIRHAHNIDDTAQGQDVRHQARTIWQSSLTNPNGFSTRIELMEILMGDSVGGSEQGSLGYLRHHLAQPESFESFLGGVAAAKGRLEEDRAAANQSHSESY